MQTALVLVDHGSREAAANEQLETVAALLRERRGDCQVAIAHMELAPPGLAETIESCVKGGALRVIVHPYFLAPGRHSKGDIPRMVQEAIRRHPEVEILVTEPLGVHPGIVETVAERISACEDRSRRG